MTNESEILPHTLSLFGSVDSPLTGLDMSFFEDPTMDNEALSTVLVRMMTMLTPEEQASRLKLVQDQWPQPRLLSWQSWQEEDHLPALKPEERRLFQIFKQLISDHRKATRYFHDFKALCDRYPDNELLHQMLCSYLAEWDSPESLRNHIQATLNEHPGWLFLRLLLARSYLHEDKPDFEGFQNALDRKLLLEQHLSSLENPLSDLLVYQFHLELYLFFSLQAELPRAAWCFNVCCTTVSDPNIMESLAPFILAAVDTEQADTAFSELMRFLKP